MANTYKSPGVSVTESQLPQPLVIKGSQKIPACIGNASSSYPLANVEVTKGSGSTDTIPGTATGEVESVTSIGSLPSLADYKVNVDYTISDNVITWIGSANPSTGVVYYITFKKVKGATFFEPTLFNSINDVRAQNGNEIEGGVISELTIAASLAFAGGASQVMCVQPESASLADQKAAIDKLETEEIYCMVAPGFTTTDIQSYMYSHVERMNSPMIKKERNAFYSALTIADNVAAIKAQAEGFASKNAVVCMSNASSSVGITLTDGISNVDQTVILPTGYIGAVVAGIMCNPNFDEAEPITEKQLSGISTLPGTKLKETELNDLAGSGVLIAYNDGGIFKVRHALTTDTSSINNVELEIWNIRATAKKQLRASLKFYIGKKFIPLEIQANMIASIVSFCEQKVSAGIFAPGVTDAGVAIDKGYRNIIVTQDSQDPRKLNVHFEFRPVYTLVYVDVDFSMYL